MPKIPRKQNLDIKYRPDMVFRKNLIEDIGKIYYFNDLLDLDADSDTFFVSDKTKRIGHQVFAIDDDSYLENMPGWPELFYNFPNLLSLEISGLYKKIPKSIYSLNSLKLMAFSNCYVDELSTEFFKLKKLEYLDLNGNYFERWLDILYLCNSIRFLDLSYNNAKVDLVKIADMPNLEFLSISSNQTETSDINEFLVKRPDVFLLL